MELKVGIGPELTRAAKLRDEKKIPEMMAVLEEAVHRYPDSYEAWQALSAACGIAGDGPGAIERPAESCSLLRKTEMPGLTLPMC